MLRLTFDSPKSFAEQMKVVLETMQDRSTQWYPRWTPAASLAIGYVKQFVEPFVTKCVDTRRAAREDKDFVLEVLLPTEDFRGMAVPEVRRMFESSDCVQIGPDGTADQRPLAWAKGQAPKGQAKAAPHMPTTYFDVPTTPFTAESLRPAYLKAKLTRPIATKDGGTLRTVGDARAYMLALPNAGRCAGAGSAPRPCSSTERTSASSAGRSSSPCSTMPSST
jgi:hypothetical protein